MQLQNCYVALTYLLTQWSRVRHRTHKCPSPVPILSQLRPVPTTPSYFLKIYLNVIVRSTSVSPQWSLSLRFPHQNPVHTSPLPHTRHMPRPSHNTCQLVFGNTDGNKQLFCVCEAISTSQLKKNFHQLRLFKK